MKRVRVDIDQICCALEDHSEVSWFVDRASGDVFPVFEEFSEDPELSIERIEENPDGYIEITPIPSHESFRLMEEFTLGLDESAERSSLERALEMKKPFRRFKDELAGHDKIREAWYEFSKQRLERLADELLKSEGLDYEAGTTRQEV